MTGNSRNNALDVIRALAILLVLGRHMSVCPDGASPLLHSISEVWLRGGWVGVDLFFVLSGFLVSGLLFREKIATSTLSVKMFLIRRGFKIYPPFWLLIFVTLIGNSILCLPTPGRRLASELLFLQSYAGALWGHTWTLAVEEHFYLFLCLALAWLGGGNKPVTRFRRLPGLFVAIAVICLLSRWLAVQNPPYGFWRAFSQSHSRIDSLMFGALLSYCYHFTSLPQILARRFVRRGLFAFGICLITFAFIFPINDEDWRLVVFGLPVFAIGAGALLLGGLHSRMLASAPFRVLGRVGYHSYSIYLWHMPIQLCASAAFGAKSGNVQGWLLYSAAYLFGSIGGGIMMARLIEHPVLRIRDRLFPSPKNIRALASANGGGAPAR